MSRIGKCVARDWRRFGFEFSITSIGVTANQIFRDVFPFPAVGTFENGKNIVARLTRFRGVFSVDSAVTLISAIPPRGFPFGINYDVNFGLYLNPSATTSNDLQAILFGKRRLGIQYFKWSNQTRNVYITAAAPIEAVYTHEVMPQSFEFDETFTDEIFVPVSKLHVNIFRHQHTGSPNLFDLSGFAVLEYEYVAVTPVQFNRIKRDFDHYEFQDINFPGLIQ